MTEVLFSLEGGGIVSRMSVYLWSSKKRGYFVHNGRYHCDVSPPLLLGIVKISPHEVVLERRCHTIQK